MGPIAQDVAVLSVGAIADLASTEYALRICPSCSEGNPFMREPASRYLIKGAATVGTVAICHKLRNDGHTTAAKIFRWSVFAVWMGLAAHNVYVAKGNR